MSLHQMALQALNLKEGDIVKITHKVPDGNGGWQNTWSNNMDEFIDTNHEVGADTDNDNTVGVNIDGYSFPAQCLELVRRALEYKELKLNDTYTAKIYKTHIQVGCQRISMNVAKKLVKIIENMAR